MRSPSTPPALVPGPAGALARRPRAVGLVLLVVLLALVLPGCTTPEEVEPEVVRPPVTVRGPADRAPTLEIVTPLEVDEPYTEVVWPGTGETLEAGGPLLLNLYAEDGRDRTVLQNTFTDAPLPYTLTAGSVGPGIARALEGQRAGARVLYVEEDDGVPVVLVVDVLSSSADGDPVAPVEGLPVVEVAPDGTQEVTIPEGVDPPGELVVQPLLRGHGTQVEAGQVVTVRYTGVVWGTGEVFDETWGEGSVPISTMIGIGQVVEGWDQGLLEQAVGSRVLLVVPPELGYGGTGSALAEDTLVYVVDVLDAHFPVVDAPDPEGDRDEEPEGDR